MEQSKRKANYERQRIAVEATREALALVKAKSVELREQMETARELRKQTETARTRRNRMN